MKIPFNLIIEGERFRKNYRDMDELVSSIRRYGLLQPLVISRQHQLLAGGRRYRALQTIGMEEVDVLYIDEVDPVKAREIELEENIQRRNFTFAEEARLVQEIHKLKQLLYGETQQGVLGGWTQSQTAVALDSSQSYIAKQLAMAKALEIMPHLEEAKSKSQALRMARQLLVACKREIAFRRCRSTESNVWHGDTRELLKKIPAGSVDCIITDPPYGTSIDKGQQYANVYFNDDPRTIRDLLMAVLPEFKRISKPDAHWYLFFGTALYPLLTECMQRLEIEYDEIPLVWVKSTFGTVDWSQRYAPSYEPIMHVYNNRQRHLEKQMQDVFNWDVVSTNEKLSVVEKPIEAAMTFLHQSTKPGELVVDPFCGSGFVGVAAKLLDRRYILIDQNEEATKMAILNIAEAEAFLISDQSEDDPEGDESDENI